MICFECGKEFEEWVNDQRVFCCEQCKNAAAERRAEDKRIYREYRFRIMLENALDILTGKTLHYQDYLKGVEAAKEFFRQGTTFDSTDEVLAMIVFWSRNFHAIPQYSIGKYRTDFYFQKQKTIVEIDGNTHELETKLLSDSNRDKIIREKLGIDWEIVRIPTKYLRSNPEKLPEAVRALRKQKVEIRRENNGIIPAYYSKQRQAVFRKLFKGLEF